MYGMGGMGNRWTLGNGAAIWGGVRTIAPMGQYPSMEVGDPRRGGSGGRGDRECSQCIECGWCKFEALLKDQDLPKAGRSACSLMQFVSEYFVVNKTFL